MELVSCADGVQNGAETGIDCGGPYCANVHGASCTSAAGCMKQQCEVTSTLTLSLAIPFAYTITLRIPGHNIDSQVVDSIEACKSLCSADSRCMAVEYATTRSAGSIPRLPRIICDAEFCVHYGRHSHGRTSQFRCYVKGDCRDCSAAEASISQTAQSTIPSP